MEVIVESIAWFRVTNVQCRLVEIHAGERAKMEAWCILLDANVLVGIGVISVATRQHQVDFTRRWPGTVCVVFWQKPNCFSDKIQITNYFFIFVINSTQWTMIPYIIGEYTWQQPISRWHFGADFNLSIFEWKRVLRSNFSASNWIYDHWHWSTSLTTEECRVRASISNKMKMKRSWKATATYSFILISTGASVNVNCAGAQECFAKYIGC